MPVKTNLGENAQINVLIALPLELLVWQLVGVVGILKQLARNLVRTVGVVVIQVARVANLLMVAREEV